MGNLMKDESYYNLYDILNKGIMDYSCSDFINKAGMMFCNLEDIKTIINDKLPLVWTDQVQVEIGEKTITSLSDSITKLKDYVDGVVSPLVSSNYVENLKNKLKDYIDAYNAHDEAYGNVTFDEEEFERYKPQKPNVDDYVGGTNNTYYQQAYKRYADYVANFDKQQEVIKKSEQNVNKIHSECEDLITKINGVLNKSSEAPAASLDGVTVASSETNTKSDNRLFQEREDKVDENGNKHIIIIKKDADGNVVNIYEQVNNKNGEVIATYLTEYHENGKKAVTTKKNSCEYDGNDVEGFYSWIEYDEKGKILSGYKSYDKLVSPKYGYEEYGYRYSFDRDTMKSTLHIDRSIKSNGEVEENLDRININNKTVDKKIEKVYNKDGTLKYEGYSEEHSYGEDGSETTIKKTKMSYFYDSDGKITKEYMNYYNKNEQDSEGHSKKTSTSYTERTQEGKWFEKVMEYDNGHTDEKTIDKQTGTIKYHSYDSKSNRYYTENSDGSTREELTVYNKENNSKTMSTTYTKPNGEVSTKNTATYLNSGELVESVEKGHNYNKGYDYEINKKGYNEVIIEDNKIQMRGEVSEGNYQFDDGTSKKCYKGLGGIWYKNDSDGAYYKVEKEEKYAADGSYDGETVVEYRMVLDGDNFVITNSADDTVTTLDKNGEIIK